MCKPEYFKVLSDLEPYGLSQKSFGGKAKVLSGADQKGSYETLFSYETPVACADQEWYTLRVNFPVQWSATTVRHFRAFAHYLAYHCGFEQLPSKLEKIKKQEGFKSWKELLSNIVEINIMFNTYKLAGDAYSKGI